MPTSIKTLRSLKDAFKQVDDPRNLKNRRDPKSGLLKLPGYDALNDNQPTFYSQAQQKLDHFLPAWTSDTECTHGRIEYRELRFAAFDLDTSLFPGARQVARFTRYYQQKCGGEPRQEARHFILSIEAGVATLVRLAQIGREHWSVENKNHWRRDVTRWLEDQSVRRKPKGAKNLALLRGAILALMPQEKFSSLNAAFDHYTEHRAEALRLLTQTVPPPMPLAYQSP